MQVMGLSKPACVALNHPGSVGAIVQIDLLDRLLVTLAVRLHAFSVCQIQRGWRLAFGSFEAVTIHYVLYGSGSLKVGEGGWVPFGRHSIIIIPARNSHVMGEPLEVLGEAQAAQTCALHGDGLVTFRTGDGTPDTLLVCGQISAGYEGALGLFELFQTPIVEAFSPDSVLHRSFDLMLAEVSRPGLATQAMTEVLMKHCFILLLRQHLKSGAGTSPLLAALKEPRLARVVLAVLERPGDPFSVESLAALAGMSRASFADRFSQVFDRAPMDFVQRVRLRIAARLLTTTDLPVKIIARSVGYASRSAFSRAFEALYGAGPTDFRSFGGQDEGEPEKLGTAGPGRIAEGLSPTS